MPRVPSRRLLPALLVLAATGLAGCSRSGSGQLLLADAPDPGAQSTDLAIYAVDPGEDPADESTRLTGKALSPLNITTTTGDGQVWVNSLGSTWQGDVLLAYGDGELNRVTAGQPGAEQEQLASSTAARTTVLRRGAFVQTAEGCELATAADQVDPVGDGNCAISLDERWVASWPADGSGLTIRDLRHDSTEQVDLQVTNVGVLSADARVLAISRDAEGYQGVLLDATDGSEIARTDSFTYLDVTQIGADADGFVLQAASEAGARLLYMDTDGTVTTIDEGVYQVPVINGAEVTYLNYTDELAGSSVRRWTPGDDEPETLLAGYVGAGSPDGEHVLATRETAEGTEFWREEHGSGQMEKVLTLERTGDDTDPSAGSGTGIKVSQMQVLGSVAYLQVDGATTTSFVRIDTVGDHSAAPVTGAEGLVFESLDVDGTALLTRAAGTQEQPLDDVLVVGPHDDEAELRATVGRTAANLIHEGTIYLTDVSDASRVTVGSLRATGSDDQVEELYADKQVAGATWPQWGGATTSQFVTPRLLLEQAQQSQQQQAQQQAAAQP